ncbi:poly-gamma-glutamate synthesis protein (capsule biosynthesis protein) [Pullulanibacillus pueri]|uniref:Capsule synthesis protein CapA domain-containing protein n=1 Tax=Pullulanibacillus pueri TaxID=1437324 RepID=A0A8J2ZSQ8_9BACL|nr:CapA family protein [Pullulanibacillus pueri]MBM7681831.1 poly-gamma-glutamate synthesis protein (capsule biosynthesis protein) [Pullulanibacillus pueri]GGH76260.1 hypothetical protein GCM10007096_06420 [Pullulanibacillus pueri]
MRYKWVVLYGLMLAASIGVLVIFFTHSEESQQTQNIPSVLTSAQPHKTIDRTVTLAAVGDVLIHSQVYEKAKTKNGYDFRPMFEEVKPILSSADIAVANQESMMGGESIGLSTYPAFNSPFEIGDALKDTGFDVVTMANNHTLDHGEKAIQNAIHYWDKIGMVHTGSFLSEKDRNTLRIVEKNDIKFAFLAYTYGTNGIPTPKNKEYLVNRIDLPTIKKDVKAAKKKSDVVVVALHFGQEYETMPNADQKQLVQALADEGVDIIIGNHPHVLQPLAWVKGKSGHKTFVAYSLGNFLSGQDELNRKLAGILELKIDKVITDSKTTIKVSDPTFTPTWVDQKDYHIIPLSKAGNYGLKDAPSLYKKVTQHMKEWMPALKF